MADRNSGLLLNGTAGVYERGAGRSPCRRRRRALGVSALIVLLAGCASQPPSGQGDICAVFDQHPDWYDHARKSEKTWGTPVSTLMAFVRHESAFRSTAKPPRRRFLFIPLGRPSSAEGFAQVVDPTWDDYQQERGAWFRGRGDMKDALDFIGWYNHRSVRQLGLSGQDPGSLYLAYHEGHGGYRRGSYRNKPGLLRTAGHVARTAQTYHQQLQHCDHRFRCRKWYQFGAFCR